MGHRDHWATDSAQNMCSNRLSQRTSGCRARAHRAGFTKLAVPLTGWRSSNPNENGPARRTPDSSYFERKLPSAPYIRSIACPLAASATESCRVHNSTPPTGSRNNASVRILRGRTGGPPTLRNELASPVPPTIGWPDRTAKMTSRRWRPKRAYGDRIRALLARPGRVVHFARGPRINPWKSLFSICYWAFLGFPCKPIRRSLHLFSAFSGLRYAKPGKSEHVAS